MWHEGIASRGGNEIASCLLSHLKSLQENTRNIIFYSDSCFGQNKNSLVALMFSMFSSSNENIDCIDHKFLVPGHTHMECDIDHSIIERKKKNTSIQIHHPRDWFQLVRSVGVKRQFKVIEMQQSGIFDFSSVIKNKVVIRKVSEEGDKINWKNIRWLRYEKVFGLIQYKNSLRDDEPFKTLNIRKRGVNDITYNNLPVRYTEPIKISSAKKRDLLSMLPLIDSCYHDFYTSLQSDELPDYHPDITEEEHSVDDE